MCHTLKPSYFQAATPFISVAQGVIMVKYIQAVFLIEKVSSSVCWCKATPGTASLWRWSYLGAKWLSLLGVKQGKPYEYRVFVFARKEAALKICFYRVLMYWYANLAETDWISWNLESIERQSVGIISWIQSIQRKSVCPATVIEKVKAARVICHAWLCASLVPTQSKSWALLLKATVESGNIDCGLLRGRVLFTYSEIGASLLQRAEEIASILLLQ